MEQDWDADCESVLDQGVTSVLDESASITLSSSSMGLGASATQSTESDKTQKSSGTYLLVYVIYNSLNVNCVNNCTIFRHFL